MYFGTLIDPPAAYGLLDRYFEAGGRFLDTANNYATWVPGGGGGESERLLGKWMKERGNRQRLFVASKVGFPVPADGADIGLRATQIQAGCESSLKRLGIQTLDLYYAHHDDRATPQEETLEAFQRLLLSGKIRLLGASNYHAWRLEAAHGICQKKGWAGFCCLQQRLSYLRPITGADFDPQVAADAEAFDYCQSRHLGLLAYSPLLGGCYTRQDRPLSPHYQSPQNSVRLDTLRAVSAELGATPNQIVLAWLMQSSPETFPVVGVSRQEQLEENLGALKVTLSEEQIYRLSSAGNIPTSHFDAKSRKSRPAK
jgi:aryl-alcohol dehydrogenase-like predicted oxidoreductase